MAQEVPTPSVDAAPPHLAVIPPPAAVAGERLREDLVHPDPLLDCLVEVCRLHGQSASRATAAPISTKPPCMSR